MRGLKATAAAGLVFASITVVFLGQGKRVEQQAEKAANGLPYCLQVPAKYSEYRRAQSLIDLTPFVMRGAGPIHHSILVTGQLGKAKSWHWSYWRQRFVKGTYAEQPIYCTPTKTLYAENEDLNTPSETHLRFFMGGKHFSIPRAYKAEPRWAARHGLFLLAIAPNFVAVSSASKIDSSIDNFVSVTFDVRSGKLVSDIFGTGYSVQELGTVNGLRRQVIGQGYARREFQYSAESVDKKITTVIRCAGGQGMDCRHVFERNGNTYEFHHSSHDLHNWELLQQNLVDLINSFEVKI